MSLPLDHLLGADDETLRRAAEASKRLAAELLGPAPASVPTAAVIAEARAKVARPTISKRPTRPTSKRPASKRRAPSRFVLSVAARERRRRFDEESKRRGAPDFDPKDLPPAAFPIAGRVMGGARGAERELARMRGPFRRAVEVAALAMESRPDGTRRPTRSLVRVRARRVIACAAVFLYLAERTDRNAYALLVEGYVRGSFCALFVNPNTGAPVHVNTLFGTCTDGTRRGRFDCGAVVALVRAGAFEKHQPSAESQVRAGKRCNVGKARDGSARALNQYWVRAVALALDVPAELAETLAPLWVERGERVPRQPRAP